jgi:hypothetical protein
LAATVATLTSGDFPVGTSYWRWPSRNSPIARACAISSPAYGLSKASCITWGSAARCRAPLLADANESHDRRIFADFAQGLIATVHACDLMRVDLHQSLYALDSTTIDLRLSLGRSCRDHSFQPIADRPGSPWVTLIMMEGLT